MKAPAQPSLPARTAGGTDGMSLTLRLFTHPACPRCVMAVQVAWELEQARPGCFALRTVSLADKVGLAEAHTAQIKTIPTLLLARDGVELERIVGAPTQGQLELALERALETREQP